MLFCTVACFNGTLYEQDKHRCYGDGLDLNGEYLLNLSYQGGIQQHMYDRDQSVSHSSLGCSS